MWIFTVLCEDPGVYYIYLSVCLSSYLSVYVSALVSVHTALVRPPLGFPTCYWRRGLLSVCTLGFLSVSSLSAFFQVSWCEPQGHLVTFSI